MKVTNLISRCASMLLILFAISGCKKDDGVTIPLDSEINEFVWQSMRTYYYWQADVPDLDQSRFQTFDDLHSFLNQYSTPELLFSHFLHSDDRFSFIVDDYEVLDNAQQGITRSFGYEFGLVRIGVSDEIFGYVQYVLPNSPAASAGLKRGDVFYAVNGISLTEANFSNLLLEQDQYILSMGKYLSTSDEVKDNGLKISISAIEINENPVYLAKIFVVEDAKVGYLVYNQFVSSRNSELNAAIAGLASEGITEMVLDLRYNPGGSITTARLLSSMLYAQSNTSTVLGTIIYNEQLAELNADLTFMDVVPIINSDGVEVNTEPINKLSINRLFILTGNSTASASEFVITGLQPYIDITLIGTTTVGKNVGSITLYDSPGAAFLSKSGINPNHRYALQPIISQIGNSVGFTSYENGLQPNVEVREVDHIGELLPLGDENEPLLAVALEVIAESGRAHRKTAATNLRELFSSRASKPFSTGIID